MKLKFRGLSYRGKIYRDIVISLVLLYVVWAVSGYPLFFDEAELRRAERTYHLEPGAVLAEVDTKANGPDFILAQNENVCEVFQIPASTLTADHEAELYIYEKAGEYTLIPLPSRIYGASTGRYKGCMLVFGTVPENAARAELTFYVESTEYTAEALCDTAGVTIFFFEGNYRHGSQLESQYYNEEATLLDSLQMYPEMANGTIKLYNADDNFIGKYPAPFGAKLAGDRF